MSLKNTSTAADAIKRLRQEIDALKQLHAEALKTATYLGMTADEAKQYDERSRKILQLGEELKARQAAATPQDALPPDQRVC